MCVLADFIILVVMCCLDYNFTIVTYIFVNFHVFMSEHSIQNKMTPLKGYKINKSKHKFE